MMFEIAGGILIAVFVLFIICQGEFWWLVGQLIIATLMLAGIALACGLVVFIIAIFLDNPFSVLLGLGFTIPGGIWLWNKHKEKTNLMSATNEQR